MEFSGDPEDGSGRGVGTLTNSLRDVRLGDLLLAQAPVEVRGDPDGPEGTALREDVLGVEHGAGRRLLGSHQPRLAEI